MNDDPCKKEREAYDKAFEEWRNAERLPLPPDSNNAPPESKSQVDLREKLSNIEIKLGNTYETAADALDKCEEKHKEKAAYSRTKK